MEIKADLHIHTKASDGEYSPHDVVSMAKAVHLEAIGITDHDTISGLEDALSAGEQNGILVIPGVEISATFDHGTLHILGYFPELPHGLEQGLEKVQGARQDRNPKIIKKLNKLGFDITMEDVKQVAGQGQTGRPHIGKVLIKKGYVASMDEAFDKFLAKGKVAYVEKEKLSLDNAISLIKRHKGISVLAHPFTLELDNTELRSFVRHLKDLGLLGIEVFYPEHSKDQIKFYRALAQEFGLVITGGTDFHGPSRDTTFIGDVGVDMKTISHFFDMWNREGEDAIN